MNEKNPQHICSIQRKSIWGKTSVLFISIVLFYAICCVRTGFAEDRNGYDLISEAGKKATSEEKAGVEDIFHKDWAKPRKFTKKELAVVQIWVNDNNDLLQILDKALQEKQWILPLFDLETLEPFPNFSGIRRLARLKMAQGYLAMEKGDLPQGVKDFFSVFTFGNRLRELERGNLVSMMIGIAIQKMALKGLESLCYNYPPNKVILENILQFIPLQLQPDDQFIKGVRGERDTFALPLTEKFGREVHSILDQLEMPYHPFFDMSESKKIIELQFAFYIENAKRPWSKRQTWPPKEWQKLEREIYQIREKLKNNLNLEESFLGDDIDQKLHFSDFDIQNVEHVKIWQKLEKHTFEMNNIIGRYLLLVGTSDFSQYYEHSMIVRTSLNLLKAMVAIKIYEQYQGKRPQQLHDLVDVNILSEMPQDLFAAGPFQYSAEKGLLWSVGPDGENNGGDNEADLILSLRNE